MKAMIKAVKKCLAAALGASLLSGVWSPAYAAIARAAGGPAGSCAALRRCAPDSAPAVVERELVTAEPAARGPAESTSLREASAAEALDGPRVFDGAAGLGVSAPPLAADGAKPPPSSATQAPAPAPGGNSRPDDGIDDPPASRRRDGAGSRIVQTAGTLGSGAATGAVAYFLWGAPAAAYFASGYAITSAVYNLQASGKLPYFGASASPAGALPMQTYRYVSTITRALAGMGLLGAGFATANPVLSSFGVAFTLLGIGETLGQAGYDAAQRLLNTQKGQEFVSALARLLHMENQAAKAPDGAGKGLAGFLARAKSDFDSHRRELLQGILNFLPAGLPGLVFAFGLDFGVSRFAGQALGAMSKATQDLILSTYYNYHQSGIIQMLKMSVCGHLDLVMRKKGPTFEHGKLTQLNYNPAGEPK